MTPEELYKFRLGIHRDTLSWKKPKRIPFWPNVSNWMFIDCGMSVAVASRDYDMVQESMEIFAQKYTFDAYNMYNSGFRNRWRVYDAFGGSSGYVMSEEENAINANAIYEDVFSANDYDSLLADEIKAMWEIGIPNLYPKSKGFSAKDFANAVKEQKDLLDAKARVDEIIRQKYGILIEKEVMVTGCYIDRLSDYFRGLKGLSLDLRRQPDKVEEVCNKYDSVSLNVFEKQLIQSGKGFNLKDHYDVLISILAHNSLNKKQFDRFFWPCLSKSIALCEEYGKQIVFNSEGSIIRFGDQFNDFKRGTVCCTIETDDPYEIRRRFKNIAIMGGLSVDLMGHSSPSECVDAAKKAIDELGYEGGLILMPNKFVTYPYDMTSENLKAVGEFAAEYGE